MASSGTTVFEKTFFIDDIIEESFERLGLINNTGNQMKAARRSLNIMFQEWSNRGLHYWEVAQNSISMVEGQSVYTIYRSSGDGTSDATFSLLNGALTIPSTVEFTVTVPSGTGGGYYIDGVQKPIIPVVIGRTYRFNQNAANNNGHPLILSTTTSSAGIISSGVSYYLDGASNQANYTNTALFNAATVRYIEITVAETVDFYYLCNVHGSSMGNLIDVTVDTITVDSVVQFPTSGTLLIDSEQITYTGTNTSNNTFNGITRGANSTTVATHADNTAVYDYNSITYGADDILEASYRQTNQSPVVDFPLTKISRSGYSALSSKFSQGTPTQYYVQRLIDRITITLYLTPGSSEVNNVMFYYYAKRIQDVGAYTNITDVPYRFVPCMCAGLTYYLAQKYSPQRTQEMKLLYEDELLRALDSDGSSTSSFITPKIYYPGT